MSEHFGVYDINVNDDPRLKDEVGDSDRIMCALNDCDGPIPPRNEGELPEMLINSINYVIRSYDALLTDCYADILIIIHTKWMTLRTVPRRLFTKVI